MGLCFSKKKKEKPSPSAEVTSPKSKKKSGKIAVVVADDKGKKTPQSKRVEPAGDKKAVFVVKTKAGAVNVEEKKRPGEEAAARPVVVTTAMPVRTSSCTREEVDAILIQCGRLSRSSSGRAASSETGHRRSKRSYDFDQERRGGDEERDWERQGGAVSRPSPHRGSPQRKRSGSRERSGGGSRRASRSPGRRGEGASSATTAPAGSGGGGGGGERPRQQQPGKMVSVPAREKGRAPSPAAAVSGNRCASPRSSLPARVSAAAGNENAGGGGQMTTAGMTPSVSRSSSPYRRSPMAEIDENSLRNSNGNPPNPHKKSSENALAAAAQKVITERSKEVKPKLVEETVTVPASETRAPSSKTATATATRTPSVAAESLNTKARSRRASRDFDQNPNSYATQLLEDIQSYHHQQQNTSVAATAATLQGFSLPACVSKACSILEAVADLNSTSSESRAVEPGRSSVNDKGSVNAPLGIGGMDDDLAAEPSVHKQARDIIRGGEAEPQESAGSNSVSGNPWTTPSWEPSSVESSDRTWSASRSTTNNADEVVEQGGSSSHGGAGARSSPNRSSRQSGGKQRTAAQLEHSVRSPAASSAGSNNSNNVHRGRSARRNGGGGGGVCGVVSGRGAWAASVIG